MMIVASMAIFGTLGPFVRNIPIPSAALALCRAVMAVALLGLYFLITKQKIDFRAIGKELPLLLISGMASWRFFMTNFYSPRYAVSFLFPAIIFTAFMLVKFKRWWWVLLTVLGIICCCKISSVCST